MRSVINRLAVAAMGCLLLLEGAGATTTQPNVVLIMADDISAREFIQYDATATASTPTLDMISNSGLYVDTAWATPYCSPSRAMLMTGRYPYQTGWYGNATIYKPDGINLVHDYETSPLGMGQVANNAGYATIWAGKTQVKNADMTAYGFDEGIFTPGTPRLSNPYTDFHSITPYTDTSYYWWPSIQRMNHPDDATAFAWQPTTINDYGPDVLLNGVFDHINRHTDDPNDPTDDADPTKPFFALYTSHLGHLAPDFLEGTIDPQTGWYNTPWTHPGTPEVVNGVKTGNITPDGLEYHVEYLDYQVSQVIDELERLDIMDETIVIVTSDNGSVSYGKGQPFKQRGSHVPMYIYGPGQFAVSGKQDIIMDLTDFLPTLADWMGYDMPADYTLDGTSLAPYLDGLTTSHRDWVYAYQDQRRTIRGRLVVLDGYGNWWDTRGHTNGDNFTQITNPDSPALDPEIAAEIALLRDVLETIPALEDDALVYYQYLAVTPDFNDDGIVNGDDIDAFNGKIGLPAIGPNQKFDLDKDGNITAADREFMIGELVQLSIPFELGTLPGDNDLDGDIDDSDLGTSFANYTGPGATGKGWADGDVDGDGDVDDSDLGEAFANYTGPSGITPVPEPATGLLLVGTLLVIGRRRR